MENEMGDSDDELTSRERGEGGGKPSVYNFQKLEVEDTSVSNMDAGWVRNGMDQHLIAAQLTYSSRSLYMKI